ncbi:MAG: hypothetical protein A3F68_07130 [Acidobacteria bacterium RIFCSPLOWO2_12_FULL_54_10]|nr:MAG: hypothetical protein A3F68_07130 [Acidobacteria bacterium RIFCSPLOWO2_12_FULL_54_10]
MSNRKNHRTLDSQARWRWLAAALALVFSVTALPAQAPDASVRGVVSNNEGQPLAGAQVTATYPETGFAQAAATDSQGEYYFGSLPRGLYSLKVEMAGYRGLEKQGVELAVGARHEENFTLAPIATLPGEAAIGELFQILPPAPSLPVETIASSVSVVVEENKILQLPLASRNIYSLFLLQPGVTSQGAIAARGLSFSVHGQRVSGSSYQLDGADNNNIVLTGPVAMTSAEAIQEFRMVNSSFSAENGRATAFVAQVVTRSGSNRFHGSVFEFLGNDKLDANTFETNSKQMNKPPLRQNQFGYSLGGPVQRNKTFFWSGLEFSRLRFGTPNEFLLPTASFIASLPADSVARRLLTEIPPVATTPTAEDSHIGVAQFQVPNRIDNLLATGRLDHHFPNTKDRLTGRYTLASTTAEPGGFGYRSLVPSDRFRGHNSLLDWTHSVNAGQVNDLRVGWSRERIWLPRPRSDVPNLQSDDGVFLPASFRQSDQRENNNVIQVSNTLSIRRGRSALALGFEFRRNLANSVTLGLQNEALGGAARFPDGFYEFDDLAAFGRAQPVFFSIGVDRFSSGPLRLPDLRREYRSTEYALFMHDDLKLSPRFALNLGLRYEYYGVPHSTDRSQDVNFYFGPGSTIEEKLANGVLRSTDQNPGDLEGLLYRRDRWNFAPSLGVAWDPFGRARTVVRAGYAIALDRILDTVRDLRSNNLQLVSCLPPVCTPSFLIPAERLLPRLNQTLGAASLVQLDEKQRTPYAQNWYIGVQHNITPNFLVEVGHAGSVGRKLISRDDINRTTRGVPRLNVRIGEDTFLSNAGNSNYLALEAGLRRRFTRGLQYQFSYTYSHAIDNQSDVFEGARTGPGRPGRQYFALATFTRQFDSRVDRGNANFDQRHNLVFNTIWDLPKPDFRVAWANEFLQGWTVSVIGAYRAGFPVTAIGFTRNPSTTLRNNRLDFQGSEGQQAHLADPTPVAGGVQWLDATLLRPVTGRVGNLGRGAIKGPGSWNYDFALLRNFPLTDDGLRLQFRAEFYNLFNHPNLSPPVSLFTEEDFGRAYYGLNRTFSRFGDLPLENPSRRIQFGLRFEF